MFQAPKWVIRTHFRHLRSKNFQWYKEFFNPMGFDAYNRSLKIQESIGTSTPKMGAHLGVWRFIPSHPPTLLRAWNVIPGLHYWPAPLQALVLVTSPRLRLWHICFRWSRLLILDANLCSMAFTSSCTFYFQFNFQSSHKNNFSFETWKVKCPTKFVDNFKVYTSRCKLRKIS